MKDCLIKVEHLKKEYANVTPINDVNAEIHAGEVISIIGPSGTGKSTFLRCLNLLEEPTSGKITVDGVEITDPKSDISKVRQKMGMVFQSFNLFAHKTIIDNMMFAPLKLLHMPKDEAYEMSMALLNRVGLGQKADNFPHELSGGQKQRVAIARAMAMKPKILLLDEPTSALDPTMVSEVLSVIRSLAKEGITMLIVTHEMRFARDVSTRIFYMDEGGIYEDGTPEQIFEHPQKNKTRIFIKRLKCFNVSITSKDFDFIGKASEIEQFAKDNYLSRDSIKNIRLAFEEIIMANLIDRMGDSFKIDLEIEIAEEGTAGTVMRFTYDGPSFDPFEKGENVSKSILKKITKNHTYSYDDVNKVSMEI